MSLGGGEILVILLVALLVFGPQRLPEISRQVGKAMREVRKMQDSLRHELHGALQVDEHDGTAHGVPSYGEPRSVPSDAGHVEPVSSPPTDPPSSGSFD